MDAPEISVVVPAYNEEPCLAATVAELVGVLDGLGKSYEVLLVDDGSTDRTPEIIRELAGRFPTVRGLGLAPHGGQTAGFEAGFRAARGALLVTLDADGQNDPAEIPQLLAEMHDADLVCGWRKDRADNWLRRVSSRVANGFRDLFLGFVVHDTGCSLKVFRRPVVESFKLFNHLHRFFPALAAMNGFRVKEVVVRHRPRSAGTAKYGVWNRVFRSLRALFAVRWMRANNLRYRVTELRGKGQEH
jgi:glycosyltransferase involved in cell wall biosynthesis